MDDRYSLGGIENERLLASLHALVARENDALSDMLAHLAEVDERGVCLELGYSSLFKYCVEALGLTKSAAGRRIAAARVCRQYPAVFARVARGELGLSALCSLREYLNPENAAELFEVCSGKSCEQVERSLAARFPKADIRDRVRRLPEQGELTPDKGRAVARGIVKPLSAQRFSVGFTANEGFCELLDEVRGLLSHAQPNGDLASVMTRALEALKTELLKKRFGVGRRPRRVQLKEDGSLANRSRHVAADVARAVWERDGGRCTFCAVGRRRCSERYFLEIDHVRPFAWGGAATLCNLRLRCRAHNLHAAREYFGRDYVRRQQARAASQQRRAPASARSRQDAEGWDGV